MRRDHEESASLVLKNSRGEVRCSVLLERDAAHLHPNRLSLIGRREDWVAFLPISGGGTVTWTVAGDPDWYSRQGSRHKVSRSGTALIRSNGMASGDSISDDTIQKFADLEILEGREDTSFGRAEDGSRGLSAHYDFLPRPLDWFAYSRRNPLQGGRVRRGDWFTVGALRLRVVSSEHHRDDRRLSQELEVITLPGVEITPRGPIEADAFEQQADALWFGLRILISFAHRQLTTPLSVVRHRPDGVSHEWRSVAVQPREQRPDHVYEEPPVRGHPGAFLAKAGAAVLRLQEHRERLHAAAFGYATSFATPLLEARLTACVEALERLVSVFEAVKGVEREIVPRSAWRRTGKALRKTVDELDLPRELKASLKRSLTAPAGLTLQDRLDRMIRHYRRHWSPTDRSIAGGVAGMIAARNHIVHGRMISDSQGLFVEVLRSRFLFEKLFLDLLGCDAFHQAGRAAWIIESETRMRRRLEPDGD